MNFKIARYAYLSLLDVIARNVDYQPVVPLSIGGSSPGRRIRI